MKTAGIAEIKEELRNLTAKEIGELCLRLARYKRDNKELLAYLLFDEHDINNYTSHVKEDIDEAFKDINRSNLYLAKKTLYMMFQKSRLFYSRIIP